MKPAESNILLMENVFKQFGENIVLNGVNLNIQSGELFGIIGMSGTGKTTLLNTIIGFVNPDKGDVRFKVEHLLDYAGEEENYRSVFKNPKQAKKIFGFAAQNPSVYDKLTPEENLDYFGALYDLPKDIRRTNSRILLKLMGLFEHRDTLAGNLSGGMKKRLDIACALIHDPKILILDEPTSDLDPILRKQMWELIKKINEKGTTILISSHFLDEIEHLCDRVGILSNNQITNVGTPAQLKNLFTKNEEVKFESTPGNYSAVINSLKAIKGINIKKIVNDGYAITIYTPKAETIIHHLLHVAESNHENILSLNVSKASLSEVFEAITEDTTKK
ncbi:ABC transporter ATP-binding protein [Candidatus Woesearchaeota archaeon]|nr:ABC transporter ATP-binding protein [Candidatus Woesearchaeota archaeon]